MILEYLFFLSKIKMKAKQPTGGGCSSCTSFTREEEPWERADGSLVLLVECAKVASPPMMDEICRLFNLACEEIRSNKHFDAHQQLHETFAKQMILFAEAIGKKPFKNLLVGSFDILLYAANSPVLLTKGDFKICLFFKLLAGFLSRFP